MNSGETDRGLELIHFYDKQEPGGKIDENEQKGSDMKINSRSAGMRDPDGKVGSRFTNMAVPRFDGGGCWQQHLQIIQAIVKSIGWSEGTAALQLFRTPGWRGLRCGLADPGGGEGKLGGSIKWSFRVL